jgi:molecular chaperone DnaJ
MTDIDFYELLECERTADGATIKSSYRRLAMVHHPDRNPGNPAAEAKFKAISEAYDCLKDPQKRAAYDQYGHAAFRNGGGQGQGQGFEGFSDIFESVFGDFMGGGRQQRGGQRRGADLRYDLEISLEEAFNGKTVPVTIDVAANCTVCDGTGAKPGTSAKTCKTCAGHGKVRAQQGFFVVERACPTCHGAGQVITDPCTACRGEGRIDKEKTLEVKIPAGVDEGTRIRISGEGEAGGRGAPPGDLYIFLHVTQHAYFVREGTTLAVRAPISFTTAALGGEIEVPGIDGASITVKIPAGIQSGKQLRHRGSGMSVLNQRGRGDLVIEISVETPTKLSPRQKELLAEFRETETGAETPASTGFFDKFKGMFGE